jgi:hypothetical protein
MNYDDFDRARVESERRQNKRLSDSLKRAAFYPLITATEMLAKHLRNYPAGMTLGELQKIAKQESEQSGT